MVDVRELWTDEGEELTVVRGFKCADWFCQRVRASGFFLLEEFRAGIIEDYRVRYSAE